MQVDEYKQLKESLNREPSLRLPEQNPVPQQLQAAAAAPESHIHETQQATILEQPQKEEPTHEEDHQGHRDAESRVMWDSLGSLYYQDKRQSVNIKRLMIFFVTLSSVGPSKGGACSV